MKILKRILLIIGAIIVILLIVAYLLPRKWQVERSVSIMASNNSIDALTGNFSNWDLWTPWTKEADSTMRYELIGIDGQVGTVRRWGSKKMGNGDMKITGRVPGEFTAFEITFNNGKFRSTAKISIEKTGDSCKVTWYDEGDNGYNPVARYFGLMMDHMLGPDFEKGLSKLKTVAEERKNWPRIEETTVGEQIVLMIRDSAGMDTYSRVMGKAYGEIMDYTVKNKLKETGKPFAIYLKWDSVTKHSVMDMGFAIDRPAEGKGRIRFEKIPAQKVVMAYHYGNYNNFISVYDALGKYIKASGKQIAGNPWEIYITDPGVEKDTTRWETDIFFPVK